MDQEPNAYGERLALHDWQRRMVFWAGAIATGAAAVLFAKGSEAAMALFSRLHAALWWWPFLSAPLGLGLCAWLTQKAFPGAEGSGMRRLTRETCDELAGLAMPGSMESLNVSAAATVALYEITRK